jgi:hypothetical protein
MYRHIGIKYFEIFLKHKHTEKCLNDNYIGRCRQSQ